MVASHRPLYALRARNTSLLLLLIPILLALVPRSPLWASTVMELAFSDVVQQSELVFEARVLSAEARDDGRMIYTVVVFELLDVLKGTYENETVELIFLGGRVGNRELRVTEMHAPAAGETGIYFVQSLSEPLVHPLVGWDQGRYLIHQDRGGNRYMLSADAIPVVGLENAAQARAQPGQSGNTEGISKGVAKGVITQEMFSASSAMSVEDFKNAVREMHAQTVP
jgi:hypothetical protein